MGSIYVQQTGFALYYIICVDVEHGLPMELIGHGIVAIAAPGMTTEDAFDTKPTSIEDPVFENRFDHVLAASRRVPAGRRCQRRYENPVKIDRQEEKLTNKEPTPPLPIGREI
jgi:hypothetical protein